MRGNALTFRQKATHPRGDFGRHFLRSGVPAVWDHFELGAAEPPDEVLALPERDDHIVLTGEDKHGMIEVADPKTGDLAGGHSPGYFDLLADWMVRRKMDRPYGAAIEYPRR